MPGDSPALSSGSVVGPSRTAARAGSPALATERDQLLGVALRAAHAQKAVLEAAALRVCLELIQHALRQR